ncbi:MAG: iron-containing alcohol dehydrogenase [Desulfovermiculus sp.]|nr:iron-containing alcohol dehydrogenase [Desulfovermiculus sp.]
MEYQDYFSFASSREIIFGNNSSNHISFFIKSKIRSKIVLIVSDVGIRKTGIIDNIVKQLENDNINFATFEELESEPTIQNVLSCVNKGVTECCDSILAIGGGSAIDLAKAASVMIKHGGNIEDYFGQNKVPEDILPIIAVPTTAGTGSEVTAGAVLTDNINNCKVGIRSNYCRPNISVLDPILTLSCPQSVTAASGFDAFSHAIGSYTMIDQAYMPKGTTLFHGSNFLTDTLAIEAIKLLSHNIRTAVHQGQNKESREKMMKGSLLAGLAFSNAGLTHTHMLTYPLSGKLHAPHGVLIAIVLPKVLEYNLQVRMERMAYVAELMGENISNLSTRESAYKAIAAVNNLINDIKLPTKLRDIGFKKQDIPKMAEQAIPILNSLPWNPRNMNYEDVIEIYNMCH